eukprot:TRINITY_DN1881_c0_g1_i1.p1 TRINITY_DN1881_c0_g1~~TRINITY_DN1881_c0_g1_i1.p1  ORF type:complete len:231 (+),score=25.49 TRINITY_DN1881_c0_g1_i1:287-979(+)
MISNATHEFFFLIRPVDQISVDEAMSRVIEKQKLTFEKAKTEVFRHFNSTDSAEIIEMYRRVSFIDPLGRTRIIYPARGLNCSHIECFDLNNYLLHNERVKTWTCPICHKEVKYDSLILDEYFYSIIKDNQAVNEIQIFKDGTWVVFTEDKENQARSTSSTNLEGTTEQGEVEIFIDLTTGQTDVALSNNSTEVTVTTPPSISKQEPVVIEILDDSDSDSETNDNENDGT